MSHELRANDVGFRPLTMGERGYVTNNNLNPRHERIECGSCGKTNQARAVCNMVRSDGTEILWCLCTCEKQEPSVLVKQGAKVVIQSPIARDFNSKAAWPPDLGALYDEAAKALSAGAHTACAMVCRKLLMATACHEGDTDGKQFVAYVDYITTTVLSFPRAKAAIDSIRGIGNEANHKVQLVSHDDARRAMQIVTYMLDTIYSLPTA